MATEYPVDLPEAIKKNASPFYIPPEIEKDLEFWKMEPWERYAAGWTDQSREPLTFQCLRSWQRLHFEPILEMLKPLSEKSSETGLLVHGVYHALKALSEDLFCLIEFSAETITLDPVMQRWFAETSQEPPEEECGTISLDDEPEGGLQ